MTSKEDLTMKLEVSVMPGSQKKMDLKPRNASSFRKIEKSTK